MDVTFPPELADIALALLLGSRPGSRAATAKRARALALLERHHQTAVARQQLPQPPSRPDTLPRPASPNHPGLSRTGRGCPRPTHPLRLPIGCATR